MSCSATRESAWGPIIGERQQTKKFTQFLQQGAGFDVGGFVGVIGRAVAGGEAAGFGGVIASGGLVAAGEGELGELEVGVRALQDVAAALGDDDRLFGQPLGLVRRAGGGAQPCEVNENVGFEVDDSDSAAAFQCVVQVMLGLFELAGGAVRRARSQWART